MSPFSSAESTNSQRYQQSLISLYKHRYQIRVTIQPPAIWVLEVKIFSVVLFILKIYPVGKYNPKKGLWSHLEFSILQDFASNLNHTKVDSFQVTSLFFETNFKIYFIYSFLFHVKYLHGSQTKCTRHIQRNMAITFIFFQPSASL